MIAFQQVVLEPLNIYEENNMNPEFNLTFYKKLTWDES